jgi:hypothetical protein
MDEGSRDVHTFFIFPLAVGKGKYRRAFSAVSATLRQGSPSKRLMNKGVSIPESRIKKFGDKALLRTQLSRRGCKLACIFCLT